MAAGDPVAVGLFPSPPAANGAALDFRLGGSTPGELVELFQFDADAVEYVDYVGKVSEKYAGSNLSVKLAWIATSAITGSARWQAAFRRLTTSVDVDVSHTYAFQSSNSSAPATLGQPAYVGITLTQAQADGIVAGDVFILRLRRLATDAADTAGGDAGLVTASVAVVEA